MEKLHRQEKEMIDVERAAWVQVNLSAIRHNIRCIKTKISGGAALCAVVKANAYGHGAVKTARIAVEEGAAYLAVATADEAAQLRSAGIEAPILILGAVPLSAAGELVRCNVTQTVFRLEQAEALSREAVRQHKQVRVHLKVDTGMGRIGVMPEAAGELAQQISALEGINLEGVFSHFATADSEDKSYCLTQLSRFELALAGIEQAGVNIPLKHIANSAAILELPETHFSMVRAGVILYGLMPSAEVANTIGLQPAMQLKAQLVHLKTLRQGETVSYGQRFRAQRDSKVATLPLGYADGYTRMLTGKACALLHGQLAPIIGSICMDQCMLDVTNIAEAALGDEVTLFGADGITAESLAEKLGTINYEIVCMPGGRLPRRYVEQPAAD